MGDTRGNKRLQASGLSIWLEPAEPLQGSLAALIQQLAGAHDGPVFPPHITVVGEFEPDDESEVVEILAELAASQTPFPVVFSAVGIEEIYWRTLYLAADVSEPLQGLFDRAGLALGVSRPRYKPHLSLMYTELDRRSRERIRDDELGLVLPLEVVVDRLSLQRTTGDVEQWTSVVSYHLHERRGLGIRTL